MHALYFVRYIYFFFVVIYFFFCVKKKEKNPFPLFLVPPFRVPSFLALLTALSCKKHGLKYICDLFEIKHTIFFQSCKFDVRYTIVSETGVSFFTSSLIRV